LNTRSQLFLDKFFAKPIAYILNFFVRFLGKILFINHDLNKEFNTIAICKFKGMGSIVQATPLIISLRKKYPKAQIIFVSTMANKKILESIKPIDKLVLLNDSGFFSFVFSCTKSLLTLIKIRPQVFIDLEIYSDFSTLFTLFTLSKNRIGFYLRSSSFRMGIYTHMMFFNSKLPIANVYLQIANLLNCNTTDAELYSFGEVCSLPNFISSKYIVVNPNASDLRLERRWDAENFIVVVNQVLTVFTDYQVVLIGSKNEYEYTQKIHQKINNKKVINAAGKTTLEELISIIKNAKLMISNDTGPMHLAFATNTPIVCLFGPCSPEQYGKSKNAYIIYKQVYCSPCVHDFEVAPCKGNNVCMKLISTNEVNALVFAILNHQEPIKDNVSNQVVYSIPNQSTLGIVNR
jgi:ADP-heptose:LPS heptosyltransferase